MSIYLGIDIGTTSAKCLAVDDEGELVALGQYAYPMEYPRQGWAEQDPEDYWRALVDVVRQCVAGCSARGYSAGDIVSLALSTQGGTLVITDRAGKPLIPAISWMDARGEAECGQLASQTGQSFWYRHTGQALSVISTACALRWLQHNQPHVLDDAIICFVPDFLTRRLCGSFVVDMPSASWTSLSSSSDRRWSNEVLEVLDISQDNLSRIVESGEVIGELLPDAAYEMGLPEGVKLVAGAFDQAAAGHGSGAAEGVRAVLSCGTAWVLYAVSSKPVIDPGEKTPVCCHVRPDQWGVVLPFSGGTTYDWLHKNLASQDSSESSGADSLVLIPHLYGEMSPGWRTDSKGSILGLTLSHTPADLELALMRGLAFETRRNMEAARDVGIAFGSVRMVGGATKSKVWPPIIADVLGIPVQVSDFPESACFGAAKLAAGEKSARWKDPGNMRRIEPDDARKQKMDALFNTYISSYKALLPLYENMRKD